MEFIAECTYSNRLGGVLSKLAAAQQQNLDSANPVAKNRACRRKSNSRTPRILFCNVSRSRVDRTLPIPSALSFHTPFHAMVNKCRGQIMFGPLGTCLVSHVSDQIPPSGRQIPHLPTRPRFRAAREWRWLVIDWGCCVHWPTKHRQR